jgi:hypothetical protein
MATKIEVKTYYSEDFRKTMIELSDNRVLGSIAMINDSDYEVWNKLVESEIRRFMVNFGIPVYVVGRSGRHVCVEDNRNNRKWYQRMVDYVKETQDKMVDAWNSGDREPKY